MRIWAKLMRNNHIIKDTVIENNEDDTRTHKVFDALTKISYEFDLSKPIWLDSTIDDFKRHSKCRFNSDNFIEAIDFDYMEFQILDED